MKNNRLRKRLCLLGGIGLMSFLVYSCFSDDFSIDKENMKDKSIIGHNKELTIAEANEWFNANNQAITKIRVSNLEKSILIKPQWSKAQERKGENYEIVETPLLTNRSIIFKDAATIDNKLELSPKKFYNVSRLVVQKNLKTGDISSFIMIIRGSYDYMKETDRLNKNNFFHIEPDFEGDVYYYGLEQGLMYGYRYKSGIIVSTIALGMEEDNEKTRATGPNVTENCHMEKIMVEVGRSCQTYTDEEFGFPVEVCEVFYSPEFVLVCDDKPGVTPPVGPDIDPNPNPNPPPLPASCAKSDEMTNDNILMYRIYTVYDAACSIDEESLRNMLSRGGYTMEWLGWTDRFYNEINPTIYDGNGRRRLFDKNDLAGKNFEEWYHIQPYPSIGIPLLEDLMELGELYNKGRINVYKFTYGIVSWYGCLSLMITNERGGCFDLFLKDIKYGKLDTEYNQCIQEGNGKTERQRIGLFIKFLDDNKSGLSVIFAYPDDYAMNAFWPQIIDENNSMMDDACR